MEMMRKIVLVDTMPLVHRHFHATKNDQLLTDDIPRMALAAVFKTLFRMRHFFSSPEFLPASVDQLQSIHVDAFNLGDSQQQQQQFLQQQQQQQLLQQQQSTPSSSTPPLHICLFLDPPQSFRRQLFPSYKANRPPLHPSLLSQLPLVEELAKLSGLPTCVVPPFEADDLLASYAKRASLSPLPLHATIVSPDKDMLQTLAWPRVQLLDWFLKRYSGPEACLAKFGVEPRLAAQAQALAGDAVDGFKGVPGVGPKTAGRLLERFGSIDGIFAQLDEVSPPRVREALREHRDEMPRLMRLAKLEEDIHPLPYSFEEMVMTPIDLPRLSDFCLQHHIEDLAQWVESQSIMNEIK